MEVLSARRDDDIVSEMLVEAVHQGIWPFRPRKIAIWYDYDIDFNRYNFGASARFASSEVYGKVPVPRDIVVDADPWPLALMLGHDMRSAIRNRPFTEPPTNIILGEN